MACWFEDPKAEAKGKLKDLELFTTEGRVLFTDVVMVEVRVGPPPTPEWALAGTCGSFLFLNDKATGFWVMGRGVFGKGIAKGFCDSGGGCGSLRPVAAPTRRLMAKLGWLRLRPASVIYEFRPRVVLNKMERSSDRLPKTAPRPGALRLSDGGIMASGIMG